MRYETLLFEIRDGIAFITINRPDKLNALNDQVVDELADAAERVATEAAIKGVILTGAGQKAFVAGADISDLAEQGPFDGEGGAPRGQAMLRRVRGSRETRSYGAGCHTPRGGGGVSFPRSLRR